MTMQHTVTEAAHISDSIATQTVDSGDNLARDTQVSMKSHNAIVEQLPVTAGEHLPSLTLDHNTSAAVRNSNFAEHATSEAESAAKCGKTQFEGVTKCWKPDPGFEAKIPHDGGGKEPLKGGDKEPTDANVKKPAPEGTHPTDGGSKEAGDQKVPKLNGSIEYKSKF